MKIVKKLIKNEHAFTLIEMIYFRYPCYFAACHSVRNEEE